MSQTTVFQPSPITLVGGGAVGATDIEDACALAPQVFAADGGAIKLLESGRVPQAVIGDFDSLDTKTRAQLPPQSLIHVREQDSTDFEKAVHRIEAPLILGVGFTGARIDHELAALHGLLKFAHRRIVLISPQEVICLAPPLLAMDLPKGARVSLFPLAPVTGRSTGLTWPIDGLDLAPGRMIATSNKAEGGRMELRMDAAGAILLLERTALAELTQALLAAPPEHGLWPVPAPRYTDLPQS